MLAALRGYIKKVFTAAPEVKHAPVMSEAARARWTASMGLQLRGGEPETDQGRIDIVETHPVAFWCVRKLALSVGSVPWLVKNAAGDVITDEPISYLINAPSHRQSRSSFYATIASSLAVTGNAYVVARASAIDESRPGSLYVLNPRRVGVRTAVNDATTVDYYEYRSDRGTERMAPEAVCHIKHPWLGDEAIGRSVVGPSYDALALYAGLQKLSRKLLDSSGGIPGMLVFSSPAGLSEEQTQDMDAMLRRFELGGDKFGKLLLVDVADGDVKFVPLAGDIGKLSPSQTKAEAAREICALFGVPPLLYAAGEGATFANQSEAHRSLWTDTIVPMYLAPIADALTAWLAAPAGLQIVPDLERVPAMSKINNEMVNTLRSIDFLTINEKREQLGYPPVPFGDRIVVNPMAIALDSALASADVRTIAGSNPDLMRAVIQAEAEQRFAARYGAMALQDQSQEPEQVPAPTEPRARPEGGAGAIDKAVTRLRAVKQS